MTSSEAAVRDDRTTGPAWGWWFAIGAGAALLGLLPWLVTGLRLPVQNLWAQSEAPESMPLVVLPFSQYAVIQIFALIVVGAAIGGVVARSTRRHHSPCAVTGILLGVLLVQVGGAVQTTIVVASGLQRSDWALFYLAALVLVVAVSVAVGILVLLLIAKAPVAGAVIGLSIAAMAAGAWVNDLVVGEGALVANWQLWLLSITRWLPAVLVGAAIAWGGLRTAGRIVAAVAGLLILWLGQAAITAVSAAAGTRVLAKYPGEMLDYGVGVFFSALTMPELALPPLIVAVAVGIVGAFAFRMLAGRRHRSEDVAEPDAAT